ncbi:unnamed protein product, partial [Ectocarpus sp. 6 AP-2014]
MKTGVCSVVMSGSLVVFIHVYERAAVDAYNHALIGSFACEVRGVGNTRLSIAT